MQMILMSYLHSPFATALFCMFHKELWHCHHSYMHNSIEENLYFGNTLKFFLTFLDKGEDNFLCMQIHITIKSADICATIFTRWLLRSRSHLSEWSTKCFPWHLKMNQLPVNCLIVFPFHEVRAMHFKNAAAELSCSPVRALFSSVHRCCMCAKAPNKGLSLSCSTCFAEAVKSLHYRNCFVIFLWLIQNSQHCCRLCKIVCLML